MREGMHMGSTWAQNPGMSQRPPHFPEALPVFPSVCATPQRPKVRRAGLQQPCTVLRPGCLKAGRYSQLKAICTAGEAWRSFPWGGSPAQPLNRGWPPDDALCLREHPEAYRRAGDAK